MWHWQDHGSDQVPHAMLMIDSLFRLLSEITKTSLGLDITLWNLLMVT